MAATFDPFANGKLFRYTTGNGQRDVRPEQLLEALEEAMRELSTHRLPWDLPVTPYCILYGVSPPTQPDGYHRGTQAQAVGSALEDRVKALESECHDLRAWLTSLPGSDG
jgi:hypothetical protein